MNYTVMLHQTLSFNVIFISQRPPFSGSLSPKCIPFLIYFSAKDSTIFIHYLDMTAFCFQISDYNLREVHLKLPLKYIEVEIYYLNLFITCTYDHLRL